MTRATIFLADPYPIYRFGLQGLVRSWLPEFTLIEYATQADLLTAIRAGPSPAALLLDPTLLGASWLTGIRHFHIEFPALPLVVLSSSSSEDLLAGCLTLGASGFIPRTADADTVLTTLRAVLDGRPQMIPPHVEDNSQNRCLRETTSQLASLTPQQMRVLWLISQGLLNKQIAQDLRVGETTVKAHVTAILHKLKAATRTQAVIKLATASGMGDIPQFPQSEEWS